MAEDKKLWEDVAKEWTPEQRIAVKEVLGIPEGKDLVEALKELEKARKENKGGENSAYENLVSELEQKFQALDARVAAILAEKEKERVAAQAKEEEEKDLRNAIRPQDRGARFRERLEGNDPSAVETFAKLSKGAALYRLFADHPQKEIHIPTTDPQTLTHQKFNDICVVLSHVLGMTSLEKGRPLSWGELPKFVHQLADKIGFKAMGTETAGEGAEWIPVQFSADFVEAFWAEAQVPALFRVVPMASKTMEIPVQTTRPRAYIVGEATGDTDFFTIKPTPNNVGTAKRTLAAKKAAVLVFTSDELEEDSAVALLDIITQELRRGLQTSLEDAIINGAVDADLDGDLWTGANDIRRLANGLRKNVELSGVTKVDGDTLTTAVLRAARAKMGKYGVQGNPDDLVWIFGLNTAIRLLDLEAPGGTPAVLTLEKLGPNATILRGQLAFFDGIPIVISPYIYENLNAEGVYDGETTDKTIGLLVWRPSFWVGDRRQFRLESDRSIFAGQRGILVSGRLAFSKVYPNDEPTIGHIRNIALV
jgi:hypothetical protein